MKKAAIVMVSLLCVSIVATVTLATVVGVKATAMFSGNSGIFDQVDNELSSVMEELETMNWEESVALNKTKIHEETKELDLKNVQRMDVDASGAAVLLRPSQSGKTYAQLKVYAASGNTQNAFNLQAAQGETLQIKLNYNGPELNTEIWGKNFSIDTARAQASSMNAVLTLYLPPSSQLNLSFFSAAGVLSTRDLSMNQLKANVTAGLVEMQNCTMDTAELRVKAGLSTVKNNRMKTKLFSSVEAGANNLVLKKDIGFELGATLKFGTASCRLNTEKGGGEETVWKALMSGSRHLTYLDGGYQVDCYMGTGSLSITAE